MKIHIVSFQNPYPPTYGGVIDVYNKIKALNDLGCEITLHTYLYGMPEAKELERITDKIYYYRRYTGFLSQLSTIPYIVNSRRNTTLLDNLCKDNFPILFEGLHTCYFLDNNKLHGRTKLVRCHNVEHEYYRQLSQSPSSILKNIYFHLESIKLKQYEKKLLNASALLAITPFDKQYFSTMYPTIPTHWIPCFFNTYKRDEEPYEIKPYVLYHGNLSVEENIKAVNYILNNIVSSLNNIRFIIAGKNPDCVMENKIKNTPNAELIANPDNETMHYLISEAQVNLLITFQPTGIKLKLIHALLDGRGDCIANPEMLTDKTLTGVCKVATTTHEIIDAINGSFQNPPTEIEYRERIKIIESIYNNNHSAQKIIDIISHLQK